MPRIDLPYARALVAAAPFSDLARAAIRRGWRGLARRIPPAAPPVGAAAARAAADALCRAPRLFSRADLRPAYRTHFPGQLARFRRRAARILDGEVEVFGRALTLEREIDWHVDRLTGRRFDPDAPSHTIDVCAGGADPKGAWEPARAGHLVELACAGRLCPELAHPARLEIERQISRFLDENAVGRGIHYAAPLEVALRAIHWIAALELIGPARASRGFLERLGGSLVEQGFFLAARLEDEGVVSANHLLGDLVGLFFLGLALDGAPGAAAWRSEAQRRLPLEAARQVGADGAHFEASTAYHRFALELLLLAHLYGRAAGVELGLGETLHRMFSYVRGILAPDGCEPGFGDGDDARLVPMVPRAPRDHAYLLPVGAVLFGDPALHLAGVPFSEEALWLCGPEAAETWAWIPQTGPAPSLSFPSGGVHLLRSERLYVALRAGSYGQRGVGGHAHNDQLSLVVHADGRPLVIDPGTATYSADPLVRDRFRGTAAHATVVIEGAEQSPILAARPFALPDRARAALVHHEDLGSRARLVGEHHGYERLAARARHQRTLTLHRDLEALLIEDQLTGRGTAALELRFPLAVPARPGASARTRARAAVLAQHLGPFDLAHALELGGPEPIAALVPLGGSLLAPSVQLAKCAVCYGSISSRPLAALGGRLRLPVTTRVVLFLLEPKTNG